MYSAYHDIIHKQRPLPLQPRMPRLNRAKLFHPYDALKPFEETIHAKDEVYVRRIANETAAEAAPIESPSLEEPAIVPEEAAAPAEPAPKPRRKRRTKAEIEADARKAVKAAEDFAGTVEKTAKEAVEDGTRVAARITKPRVPTPEIVVQYSGNEVSTAALVDAAVAQFRALKKRTKITDIKLYVKPEEYSAYYVINGEHTGRVAF